MLFPFCSLNDPSFQRLFFCIRQRKFRIQRGHLVIIVGKNSRDQLAFGWRSRFDNGTDSFFSVQSQIGLTRLNIGTVAAKTSIRENRFDLPIEVNRHRGVRRLATQGSQPASTNQQASQRDDQFCGKLDVHVGSLITENGIPQQDEILPHCIPIPLS